MSRSAEDTRRSLMSAAERLFAERGVDAVSLREINRSAGQRNASALQYHFGDRQGLLRAIVRKHEGEVEARRHALLDQWEGGSSAELRDLAAALVRPAAAKLSDPDGGPEYLRIMGQIYGRPDPEFSSQSLDDARSSINRWRKLVAPLMPEPAVDRLHRRFSAIRIVFAELARRAESSRARDHRLFASQLIDLVAAVLVSPISEETQRLLDVRRPGKRSKRV